MYFGGFQMEDEFGNTVVRRHDYLPWLRFFIFLTPRQIQHCTRVDE